MDFNKYLKTGAFETITQNIYGNFQSKQQYLLENGMFK